MVYVERLVDDTTSEYVPAGTVTVDCTGLAPDDCAIVAPDESMSCSVIDVAFE